MAGPLFWANTSSEIIVSEDADDNVGGGLGRWSERGKGGIWCKGGGGAPIDEPVEGKLTIPSDHGSGEYDITEISGVALLNFSFILMTIRDMTFSGGTLPELGMRLSNDGGSTWISGATAYRNNHHNAGSDTVDSKTYMKLCRTESLPACTAWISDLNSLMPTSTISNDMDPATVGAIARYTAISWENAEIHNAIQLVLDDPLSDFTGGVIDLAGYR